MEFDAEATPASDFMEETSILRRGPKRKRQKDELLELAAKRRSTRVRNTGKKSSQENVNYYELLQEFLPSEIW